MKDKVFVSIRTFCDYNNKYHGCDKLITKWLVGTRLPERHGMNIEYWVTGFCEHHKFCDPTYDSLTGRNEGINIWEPITGEEVAVYQVMES